VKVGVISQEEEERYEKRICQRFLKIDFFFFLGVVRNKKRQVQNK
jgi:hypothetical protein|tara:strand:- start:51 stop:185 length:135 start_codon:yes stop_codon:yes gene_type:complete